jgi:PKD repeat protein
MRTFRRSRSLRAAAALVALASVLAAGPLVLPGGNWTGDRAPSAPTVAPPTPGMGSVEVAPAYEPPAGMRDEGPLAPSTPLRVAVGLAPSDPAGLYAQEVLEYAPGSPRYHQFLTVAQLTDRFGPTLADYGAAASYFTGLGLNVSRSPDRLMLLVTGSAGTIAGAFHTSFERYEGASGVFFSHPSGAWLPARLGISGALGLGNTELPRPGAVRTVHPIVPGPTAGCAGAFGLTPCQVHTAYAENALLGSGINGSGITIGVVDAYDSAEPQPTLASDFATFTNDYSLPSSRVQYLYPVPTSVNLNSSKSNQWGIEEGLDIEWARAAAPGDSIKMTLAPDASAGLYASVDWLVAHQAVNVLSLSWGEPDVGVYNPITMPCSSACNASSDGSYTLLHPVLQAAAIEGISVFSASGDCGSADGTRGVATGYPASDPSVTGVGGTVLTINGTDGWVSEVGWSGNATGNNSQGCANQGGSGGGFSPFPRPWWQVAPGVPSNPFVRGVPDVSIIGGTGVSVVLGGGTTAVGGTSESTPIWAGIAAIADQDHGAALGLLNPSLYAIARGSSASTAFHDIQSGSNGYHAGAGWDPVTGLGTPIVGALVPLLAGSVSGPPSFYATVHATPRFGPVGLVTTFQAAATGGTGSYPLVDIDFGDGNASFAPGGSVQHLYDRAGAFTVRATVFDSSGNSTTAPPVAVVVGGGSALNVTLTPSTNSPSVGTPIGFTAGVSGGTGPYRYNFSFGDGTYLDNSTGSSTNHTYASYGGYCAAVEVRDLLPSPDGGASARVILRVGGAAAPPCEEPSNLSVTLGSSILSADVPGDFPFLAPVSGGAGPITTQLVSDDPYVAACNCGIFRTVGAHAVTVFANDSLIGESRASINVTTFPALVAQFSISAPSGTAPLAETFTVIASGGHLTNASRTYWSFGDGSSGRGANVGHVYSTPGLYVAVGNLSDSGFGNSSEAFLIDVLPTSGGGVVLTANITPAIHTASGAPMTFTASASGGTGPYRFHWDLGDGNSAFGSTWAQTYSPRGCLATGACPLTVILSAVDANGAGVNASISLSPLFSARWSALTLYPTMPTTGGATPFPFRGTASAAGIAPANLTWSFGDGGSGWGGSVRHTFLSPGNFTVVVRASDGFGDQLVRTNAFTITGLPQAGPSASGGPNVTSGEAPLRVGFSANGTGGSGGPYLYNWSFGDASPAVNASSAAHQYNRTGVYDASLTVTDAIGTTATLGWSIDVYNSTYVQTLATPSFPSSGSLALALRVIAACGAQSIRGCSDALVQVHLTWSKPGGSSFPGNRDAGVVSFPASGYANVTIGLPSEGGTYQLAVAVVGPAFTGGVTLVLGLQGTYGTLGGLVLPPWLILGVATVFAAALTGMFVVAGRSRRTAPAASAVSP